MRYSSTSSLAITVAVFALGGAQPASADAISLQSLFTGGNLSYSGGTAPLTGTLAIGASFVINQPGPRYFIYGLTEPFTTGPFTGSDATHWFFGPGGSLDISGSVRDVATGSTIIPDTTLMTGSFAGPTTLTFRMTDSSYTLNAPILEAVDPALSGLLGLPSGLYEGSLSFFTDIGIDRNPPPGPTDCYLCLVEVDIKLNPVPEPNAVLLLATTLVFCAVLSRVRFQRRP